MEGEGQQVISQIALQIVRDRVKYDGQDNMEDQLDARTVTIQGLKDQIEKLNTGKAAE